jgi:hypothetical protein
MGPGVLLPQTAGDREEGVDVVWAGAADAELRVSHARESKEADR